LEITSLSLYELNTLIRQTLETVFVTPLWVRAEIARVNVTTAGHCFLELIDRSEISARTAKGSAVLWAGQYRAVASRFYEETGIRLTEGIKILMLAEVSFHEEYGLKLIVRAIDSVYTLGEMALKKQAILERLKKERLLDRNRLLTIPLVPQRIAIISSKTAAGFQDFMHHLESSPYQFHCQLFESLMQGNRVEESLINALDSCKARTDLFDLLVIVRGGGGRADLHCFDNYELGKAIALFPIPVISGIGHERDTSVVDETAHTRVKTPTAAAEFVITMVRAFDQYLDSAFEHIVTKIVQTVDDEKNRLSHLLKNLLIMTDERMDDEIKGLIVMEERLKRKVSRVTEFHRIHLLQLHSTLQERSKLVFTREQNWLQSKMDSVRHLDPRQVLKRGFSITYGQDGKVLRQADTVKIGESITTRLYVGTIQSRVEDNNYGSKEVDL
jgi:exodeoxyribonuclease VII large subunit